MSYLLLKSLHVGCVIVSGLGFALRGFWMLRASPLLQHPLTRRLPHVVDSVLLGSALLLAWVSQQYPFAQDWLSAKLCGLLVYIVCGALALKRCKSRNGRLFFLVLAMLAYVYIVSVALHRSPLPWQ
jgi:uncharacterized membrane protein SirB2